MTMIAFAANSVLNRMAVDDAATAPSVFALLRVMSGAVILGLLAGRRISFWGPGRAVGSLSLAIYLIGFSLAYRTLDAGVGALILFGTVQVAMFSWAAFRVERPALRQFLGATVAFAGLGLILWPSGSEAVGLVGSLLMLFAGLGWATYTLNGRGVADPLAETAANFIGATPILCIAFLGASVVEEASFEVTEYGAFLAVLSGAVTSGLGYTAWYSVLPQIAPQTAAVVQLSVPLIAIAGGAVLLGEPLTMKVGFAAFCVLGGIGLAVARRPGDSG